MKTDLRLEKLTRQGISLLQEERDLALKGDFGALDALAGRKQLYLEQLDALAAQLDGAGPTELKAARRQELETLFEILRRRAEENRFLLKAAESGVKSARRDVDRLFSGEIPLGAYSASGDPVEIKYKSSVYSELL